MIKRSILAICVMFSCGLIYGDVVAQKSTTGSSVPYREVCKNAALDDSIFQNFRSTEAYFNAVECGQSGEFADYIRSYAKPRTLSLISQFRKLEQYGKPVTNEIQGWGQFSGTTLRYILIADHISRLFNLPKSYKVAEIGAGFGGQAYILSQLVPFSEYYIYDLPEVEMLIGKMMSTLSLRNVTCLEAHAELPVEGVDLLISNYAFSECDRATQLDYFDRVIAKAKRGYMLYNDTNIFDHLSLAEFIELLASNGINPTIHPEPVFSYTGNTLIIWDRTKP